MFLEHSREITPAEAYHNGRISLRGAIKLAGLFDVHPSLITSSKRRDQKKRIRRPGQQGSDDQVKITLAEAMKQGMCLYYTKSRGLLSNQTILRDPRSH